MADRVDRATRSRIITGPERVRCVCGRVMALAAPGRLYAHHRFVVDARDAGPWCPWRRPAAPHQATP